MKLKEKDLLQLGLRQFIRVYEDNMATETWTFDLDKSTKGPIKVEIQWKHKIDEDWDNIQKTSKAMRSIERNQKKGKKIPLTLTPSFSALSLIASYSEGCINICTRLLLVSTTA